MKKLIVIEGADGVGKSTQAKLIAEHYNAHLVSQPSSDNCVGFIRSEAKLNPTYTALERQLLIAVSHTVDAFTKFSGDNHIVMDRSYLSGLVYGELTGVEKYELGLLHNILSNVYIPNTSKFETHVIFIDADKRWDMPDDDVFEQHPWVKIRDIYRAKFEEIKKGSLVFSKDETLNIINNTGKTKEEVFSSIVALIGK